MGVVQFLSTPSRLYVLKNAAFLLIDFVNGRSFFNVPRWYIEFPLLYKVKKSQIICELIIRRLNEMASQFPCFDSKMESPSEEANMLDELNSQMFSSTTTSMANMTMMPQSSTVMPQLTTQPSMSNMTMMPQFTTQPPMSNMSMMPQLPSMPLPQSSTEMPQLPSMPQLTRMLSTPTMSTMVGPQQSMPPPPPVRGSSMDYYNSGEMSAMPPPPPPLKQEYPIKQEYPVKQEYPIRQEYSIKQEYPTYEWNYYQRQQPQSISQDETFNDQMRCLPSSNCFNKPPYGFKSKVKIFIGHLRAMIPSIDEGFLALLNIIDQNHYGLSMPDNGETIIVDFNDKLDVYFKRKWIDYAVDGKVLILLLKLIFKVFRIY